MLVQKELKNGYIGEWVDVTSLTLDKSSITLTTVGQTEQITATTVPAGATVNWSSSDTTVATVSSSGLVTCVTPGSCTITAESFGVTATCGVTDQSGWQPGASTVIYYPLTSTTTVNDESGNSRDLTNNGILFGTYQGVDCAYNSTARKYLLSPTLTGTDLKTISLWTYREGTREVNSGYAAGFTYGAGTTSSCSLFIHKESSSSFKEYYNGVSFGAALTSQWCNIVIVLGDDVKCYRNGTLIGTGAAETHNNGQFYIFAFINNLSGLDVYYGGISNFIVENAARTAQEVTDYYNLTKSNYGL